MAIKTTIKEEFTAQAGTLMVRFDAMRNANSHWAAPRSLVVRDLREAAVRPGTEVTLVLGDDGNVSQVSLLGQAARNARPAAAGAAHHPPGGGAPAVRAKRLPYGFIPIDLGNAVADVPVWHDGANADACWSGEILCTLVAKTPLLPGNIRYTLRKDGKTNGALQVSAVQLNQWGFTEFNPDRQPGKQIAEPLRLADGHVVIAGTALKGMLRHSLGALLSAPMERVAEHHYSYRPNLDFNNRRTVEKLYVRPALVTAINPNGSVEIEVFAVADAALFVRDNANAAVRAAAARQDGMVSNVVGITQEGRHIVSGGNLRLTCPHRLADYKGGIDGKGFLAAAFAANQKKDTVEVVANTPNMVRNTRGKPDCRRVTYDLALVPVAGKAMKISEDVYAQYVQDQEKVLANSVEGHLCAHPLKFDVDEVKKAIVNACAFETGQLIYVEIRERNGHAPDVVSCGHHFRYRRAYTSSVRTKGDKLRPCLAPLADEHPAVGSKGKDQPPQRLSGARLLFGYVHPEKDHENPIGRGVYERLAGRVAINHALSVGVPMFLKGTNRQGHCVPLKILGQPKPSAWEFYLQQPASGALNTYGDLPGNDGGDLAGRKFYRHDPQCSLADIEAVDADAVKSEQATLARFICDKNTQFRYSVRFANLRPWELGALLAVLEPARLAEPGNQTPYAHKLGLGRPLGMGSVMVTVDKLRVRKASEILLVDAIDFADQEIEKGKFEDACVGALATKLGAGQDLIRDHIHRWLDAHAFVDRGRLAYPMAPRDPGHPDDVTIFNWHTDIRREYSKLRRQSGPDWTGIHKKIRDADPKPKP